MDRLYIIIPAYNERANIRTVACEWHRIAVAAGPESRLVIIDDGSTDDTFQILTDLAEELPQLLPLTKANSGHGSTLLYGYHFAVEHQADYIFQTDSDGQTLPSEFQVFWDNRRNYDAIIGHRNHREDGLSRIFVTKTLKLVLRFIFRLNVVDANTPYRLMSGQLLKTYLPMIPDNFNLSNVLLTVLFLKNQENITFVPITFRPRQGGVNSINFRKITKIGLQAVRDFREIKKQL